MFIHKPPDTFDPEKHFKEVPICQGIFFRKWQQRYGRKVVTLAAEEPNGKIHLYIQCIEHKLPLAGSVWVATQGPLGSCESKKVEEEFYRELVRICREEEPKTSHVRIQKKPKTNRVKTILAEKTGGSFVHPIAERIIPVHDDIENIVNGFAKNTKRIIRQYENNEKEAQIQVEKTDFKSHMQDLYELITTTANARGFSPHPFKYYEALLEELNTNPEYGTLTLGYGEDRKKPIATMLVIYSGVESYHLFSGNTKEGYEKNLPTLMNYATLQETKEQGLERHNMGGVSDGESPSLNNLSIFKAKFGGEVVVYEHPRDLVVSKWRYYLFRAMRLTAIAKIRRFIMKWGKRVLVELSGENTKKKQEIDRYTI